MHRCSFSYDQDPATVPGAVLCRDTLAVGARKKVNFRRGTELTEVLKRLPPNCEPTQFHIIVPTSDEIAQPDASARIAERIAGAGVIAEEPHQGQVTLKAEHHGLLRVNAQMVAELNRSDAIMVATSLDGRVVATGEGLGIVKAPALFVEESAIAQLEGQLTDGSTLRVAPFTVRKIGLISGQRIRPVNLERSIPHLENSLQTFGAELSAVETVVDDSAVISDAYRRLLTSGVEFILVAGSIVLDPDDPFIQALSAVDGEIIRRGAPIEPGTMFWAAYIGHVPVFGLASCEMYGRLSILNLLLPYALAREPISKDLLADLGYGGLLQTSFCARLPE